MRCRRSSKLKSTFGSCVRGFGCGDMGAVAAAVREDDAEVEKDFGGGREVLVVAAMLVG
jgi:hypothetical protein